MSEETQTTISETPKEENVAVPEAVEQIQTAPKVENISMDPELEIPSPLQGEGTREEVEKKVVVDPGNPNKVTEIKGDTVTITEVITPQPPIQEEQPKENIVQKLLKKAKAKIQEKKRNKLNKILVEVQNKGRVTNDEVEKLLHVSDATATNYLNALEKEGKLRQVGTGKHTYYERI